MKIQQYTEIFQTQVKLFILTILEGEFGHINVSRPDLDNISEFYQVDNGNFWLAIQNNQIIGTIGLKNYNGKAYMKRMAVHESYRGRGIAQELLNTFTNYAKEMGFKEIYLSTSKNLVAANKFYAKEGFEKIEILPKEIPPQIAQINYVKFI